MINAVEVTAAGLSIDPITLGQYIPSHFGVEATSPSLANTCEVFSYLGQNIGFSENLEYTVTAFNANGVVTSNYGGNNLVDGSGQPSVNDLWQLELSEDDITFTDTTGNGGEVFASFSAGISEEDFDGEATYTLTVQMDGNGNTDEAFTDFTTPVVRHVKPATSLSPFEASFDALLSNATGSIATIEDSDGVCFRAPTDTECQPVETVVIDGASMRYGRLTIENAFGPETENIITPFVAEYFNQDDNFVLNTEDNCTDVTFGNGSFATSAPTGGINNLSGSIPNIASDGQLLQGRSLPPLQGITVPTIGVAGGLTLSLLPQSSTTGQTWDDFLNFDWNGDGVIDDDDMPSALIAFGIFRGNDRIIHWREVTSSP